MDRRNLMDEMRDPSLSGALGVAPMPGQTATSWAAILAGASVAAAATLILLALGAGIGFAAPAASWSVAAIWLVVTQWLSAALGGYLTGRLRIRWFGTNPHEVFFRDTAHGLLSWAVAAVVMTAFIGGALGESGRAAGQWRASPIGERPSASASASSELFDGPYQVDRLFRAPTTAAVPAATVPAANDSAPAAGAPATDPRSEAAHILANASTSGTMSDTDRSYLAGLIAQRTGASMTESQQRVQDWLTSDMQARRVAAAARRTAARVVVCMALSMLIGAFIASVSAALGGRIRDEHP